jgi:hypothetical protein
VNPPGSPFPDIRPSEPVRVRAPATFTAVTWLIGALCALGMVVVVPLGLRLLGGDDDPLVAAWARVWPVAGAVGALSMLLPRGGLATGVALLYAGATVALALTAPVRLWRTRSLRPAEVAVLTALVAPSVAGLSLVAERAGYDLLGFEPTVLALTVAHFHFAGFAAALVAGLVAHATGSRVASAAALTVPAGTLLVLLGYFVGDAMELAGAAVLTAGMWAVGWLTWTRVRSRSRDRLTRALLGTSAVVLAATMVLALSWAAGHVWDVVPHLPLTWMVATHGVANALGFALCGLLAWRRLREEDAAAAQSCAAATG